MPSATSLSIAIRRGAVRGIHGSPPSGPVRLSEPPDIAGASEQLPVEDREDLRCGRPRCKSPQQRCHQESVQKLRQLSCEGPALLVVANSDPALQLHRRRRCDHDGVREAQYGILVPGTISPPLHKLSVPCRCGPQPYTRAARMKQGVDKHLPIAPLQLPGFMLLNGASRGGIGILHHEVRQGSTLQTSGVLNPALLLRAEPGLDPLKLSGRRWFCRDGHEYLNRDCTAVYRTGAKAIRG